ncbi:hypothetical protein MUK70_11745 [Dyadobacter chenwenxiniae]|uniref:Uncharacterized protein n=1 Tax=Dyadobacter chenwenxiniae TaxID=2906456 RepID=A0A9X1PH65_9BACT|nr:hypothetical protein [Dyadobacter chenwenxiniae]MCF0059914.1 hypothetical protein [Dyadobacter chenwenxiniae]UON85653.1 hypothetical protein MUK70_11745 [Dyadobacter chenwenxiniae]
MKETRIIPLNTIALKFKRPGEEIPECAYLLTAKKASVADIQWAKNKIFIRLVKQ